MAKLVQDNNKHSSQLSHFSQNSIDSLRDMNRETTERVLKLEERVSLINDSRLRELEQNQIRFNSFATVKQL